MKSSILFTFLIWQYFHEILASTDNSVGKVKKCPFRDTVDLTNQKKFENGSYLYQGIIVPPEKQAFYDAVYYRGKKKSVPLHLRGCINGSHAWIHYCCGLEEYYNEAKRKCQNITWKWESPIEANQHFRTKEFEECWEPTVLQPVANNWSFIDQGILTQTQRKHMYHGEFCFSPVLVSNRSSLLKAFTCRVDDDYNKNLINQYNLNISLLFLMPTLLMNYLFKQLRISLPDKLCFYYITSMAMGNAIFSVLNIVFNLKGNVVVFVILGFLGYSFHIVALLWLSVLSYDIWLKERKPKQLTIYSLYVGISACIAIVFLISVKNSWVRANIDKHTIDEICQWNAEKWSALQFYGLTLLILIFTCLKFAHSAFENYKIREDVEKYKNEQLLFQQNAIFISRLFLILGLPWIVHIMSYYVDDDTDFNILFILVNFGDGIQGILIFLLFVWTHKIWLYFKQKTCTARTPQEDCIPPCMTEVVGQN